MSNPFVIRDPRLEPAPVGPMPEHYKVTLEHVKDGVIWRRSALLDAAQARRLYGETIEAVLAELFEALLNSVPNPGADAPAESKEFAPYCPKCGRIEEVNP